VWKELKSAIKRQSWWYVIFDTVFYQKLLNVDSYNSFLKDIDFYKSIVGTSNKLIFDVGANVGTKSKIFSLLSEKVVAFEPDLQNLKILNARLKYNKHCVIDGYALSSKESTAKYYSIGNDSAYNSLSEKHINTVVKSRKIVSDKNGLTQYEVKTNTLDFFIDKYGKPDYIKIDVEGFEKEVVSGLNILVALISIEANLPEFLPETIDIVNYLDKLSKGGYLFNYAINNYFELKEFVNITEFKKELSALQVKSIEVYCSLNVA
jgi:FkbM family methyltransferase